MSQQKDSAFITLVAASAIGAYIRVGIDSNGKAAIAGLNAVAVGITQRAVASGEQVSVKLLAGYGTHKMTANAAITAYAPVFGTANGKIDDAAGAGDNGAPCGVALEAATAQNDVIEVLALPSSVGVQVVAGQHTTVAASDTVVTGLSKLHAVIAVFDDDIGDDPEWVTASIGNQSGAPAAGSFLLKTWKNTAGNDPTPAAATTFTKKVNWIAVGY